jgi:hypothetical protein
VDDLKKIERRTYRYWYEDGVTDIASGWVFLMVGMVFLIEALAPAGPLAGISAIALPVVVIGGVLLARWAVAAIKRGITYPRTGFVSYRKTARSRRWLAGAVAAGMAIVITVFARLGPLARGWIPLFTGLFIGLGLMFMGYRFNLGRYYALAACSLAAGLAAATLTQNETAGSAVYFCAMGLALVASGALTLWGYLRRTQPPAEQV